MMIAPAFGQTISVVDKSGKVVSTSKHLFNVFKEARAAYRERKAEIFNTRYIEEQKGPLPPPPYAYTINDDDRSSVRSRGSHRRTRRRSAGERSEASSIYPSSKSRHEHGLSHGAPKLERSVTSPVLARPVISPRSDSGRPLGPPRSESGRSPRSESGRSPRSESGRSPRSPNDPRQELTRRHTSMNGHEELAIRPRQQRSMSAGGYDPDLAYGELPPDLQVARTGDEVELKGLVGRVKFLLVEADCLQHSVTAMISNLQKNPEAMAAVALTLAEISNIVTKMSPSLLTAFKAMSPAVFGLLASPQFLIAAGVGVGITIVAFGGYKIIKKIQDNANAPVKMPEPPMEEMIELGSDVSRIDTWRRGIAEIEASAVGTSVEGELITPKAAKLKARMKEERIRESQREGEGEGERVRSAKSSAGSSVRSKRRSKSSRSGSQVSKASNSSKTLVVETEGRRIKEKKPSPLRMMFNAL